MSRWKAAAIHLSISAAIGLVAGALLLFVWYRPPYFHAAGADELVLLLVGVDVVLGPLLTLVLFRSGKKGLKFDLTMIVVLQGAALIYGMSVVLQSRPVFLVAAVDRFTLISANEIEPADLAKGRKPEFRSLPWTGPRTVAIHLPESGKARTELVFASVAGKQAEKRPEFYVDYNSVAPDLLRRAKPLDELPLRDPKAQEELDMAVRSTGNAPTELLWVPVTARRASLTMLLDRKTGAPVCTIAIDPWKP